MVCLILNSYVYILFATEPYSQDTNNNAKLADHVKYLHSEIFLQTHRKGEGLKTWRNHNKPHEIAQRI